jgi:4-hydroxy-3-methylbut-2-enyl diphosphate reductase
MFKAAMRDRYGDARLGEHYRAFETICSATQDRQDAVVALLDEHDLDLMVVIGGYNSSNTCNLARICAERLPTYHIAGPDCLVSPTEIRHCPVGVLEETSAIDWLSGKRPVVVGLTAGASTPDVIVGAIIERLASFTATDGRG